MQHDHCRRCGADVCVGCGVDETVVSVALGGLWPSGPAPRRVEIWERARALRADMGISPPLEDVATAPLVTYTCDCGQSETRRWVPSAQGGTDWSARYDGWRIGAAGGKRVEICPECAGTHPGYWRDRTVRAYVDAGVIQ